MYNSLDMEMCTLQGKNLHLNQGEKNLLGFLDLNSIPTINLLKLEHFKLYIKTVHYHSAGKYSFFPKELFEV